MSKEEHFSHFLLELLFDYSEGLFNPEFNMVNFESFEQAGVSPKREGFIATTSDGSDFYISINEVK